MGILAQKSKNPGVGSAGAFCFNPYPSIEENLVDNVKTLVEFMKALLDKYGYWAALSFVCIPIAFWKFPEALDAVARFCQLWINF